MTPKPKQQQIKISKSHLPDEDLLRVQQEILTEGLLYYTVVYYQGRGGYVLLDCDKVSRLISGKSVSVVHYPIKSKNHFYGAT